MESTLQWAAFGSLIVAGLAGSLHCIGMCGPILVAFSHAFDDRERAAGRRSTAARDFVFYHAGRIWTYGLLGLLAGLLGRGLQSSVLLLGWQRGVSIALAAAVVLSGVLLTGIVRLPGLERVLGACGAGKLHGRGWFATLVRSPGVTPRLLLGAVMGLLPCGLVYAALVVAATLPTPAHSAAGMVSFGLGTVPSLSLVLLAGRRAPVWLRIHGTRLVGIALILIGGFMIARTLSVNGQGECPACRGRAAVTAAP